MDTIIKIHPFSHGPSNLSTICKVFTRKITAGPGRHGIDEAQNSDKQRFCPRFHIKLGINYYRLSTNNPAKLAEPSITPPIYHASLAHPSTITKPILAGT